MYLRGARDRLVDLLKLGETAPLQDTEVLNERLTVPIGDRARIPIVPGQPDVRYLLRRRDGRSSPPGPGKVGNGGKTLLKTPVIEEDVTYRVLARKEKTRREALLHQSAAVKVGLDRSLRVWINEPPLDPQAADDTAARIVDYGRRAVVKIDESQEGVDYRLVGGPAGPGEVDLSSTEARGDRGTIELRTGPVTEDTMIRVRATKRFDPTSGRANETELLVGTDGKPLKLPLMVRPNRALDLSVEPSNVLDLGGVATLSVDVSQKSCHYRIHSRPLLDSDFVFDDDVAGAAVAEVDVDDSRTVRVILPLTQDGEAVEGFTTIGDEVVGNGGRLQLPLGPQTDDALILIEAIKEHSAVWLGRAATTLVRPDPNQRLQLRIPVAGTRIRGPVVVSEGQPGAFYYVRRGKTGGEHALPAYFHQVDEVDDRLDKGLGGSEEPTARRGLRVAVDLVIARDADETVSGAVPSVRERLARPAVVIEPLPVGIELHVRARKARSGVDVQMKHPATTFPMPQIRLDRDQIIPGGSARIRVVASQTGDRYRLHVEGKPVEPVKRGNGEDLVFTVKKIERPTTFEVEVFRKTAGAIVLQVVELSVDVKAVDGGT